MSPRTAAKIMRRWFPVRFVCRSRLLSILGDCGGMIHHGRRQITPTLRAAQYLRGREFRDAALFTFLVKGAVFRRSLLPTTPGRARPRPRMQSIQILHGQSPSASISCAGRHGGRNSSRAPDECDMHLTPREIDKLLIASAAELSR